MLVQGSNLILYIGQCKYRGQSLCYIGQGKCRGQRIWYKGQGKCRGQRLWYIGQGKCRGKRLRYIGQGHPIWSMLNLYRLRSTNKVKVKVFDIKFLLNIVWDRIQGTKVGVSHVPFRIVIKTSDLCVVMY